MLFISAVTFLVFCISRSSSAAPGRRAAWSDGSFMPACRLRSASSAKALAVIAKNRYRLRVRPIQAANAPRGLQPVHHGHHHIHQNHVDVAWFGGSKRVHRLPSVRRLRHNHALVLQHELGDFHIQVVIFHQQHLCAADGNRPAVRVVVGALGVLILFKGQADGKR